MDPCSQWDTANIVRPGSQADEFGRLIIEKLLDEWKSKSSPLPSAVFMWAHIDSCVSQMRLPT
ncbi:hypothetical protein C4D60_Mb08t15870 [Musa balbisiana]|uniref:Uncharacterized protein n=1 Tax=Musa balbisiana TaxID=52838 RepID=A0A4S8K429_MUSBA|nr:hypothetical protein C4D60_Mb08t15870 [Musa balbisiana]